MKQRTLILKMAAVLLGASCCMSLRAVNTIIHNATYDFSNLSIGSDTLGGVNYATISYGDLFNGGAPGLPSLPIDYIRFSVPWNATNFTVSASLLNNSTENIHRLVYPCQAPRLLNDTTPVTITLPDSAAYYSNSYYPAQNAWVVDEGFLAGENHIVTVAVMPVSFKHSGTGNITSDLLKKSQTVRLTLSYQLSDSLSMYPIVREDSALRQEGYALTRGMVVNPSSVVSYSPIEMTIDSMGVINPSSGDGLNGGPNINPNLPPINNDSTYYNMGGEMQIAGFPYLIVTTDELAHSVRRIAALKRQKGYGVKVVTMSEVLNSEHNKGGDRIRQADGTYQLVDTTAAGKLRQYLKYCYRIDGTQYVLLAGSGVPYKLKKFFSKDAPSDLYFSDLNADWSADTTEKYPELYIGRLLADCSEQITNYSDKLYIYEINPGQGESSYLKRALYTEGYDAQKKNEVQNLKVHSDSIFTSSYVMLENTSGTRYPSGVDIVNEINNHGYGYLSFHNHAYPTGILTYGHRSNNDCQDDTVFHFLWAIDTVRIIFKGSKYKKDLPSGNGLNCLVNKYHPSISYSIACTTMPYDTLPYYETVRMNFGQSFTVGGKYGGVAFLGNTREGYFRRSSLLEEQFIHQINIGNHKLGPAEAISKVFFNYDYIDNNSNGTIIRDKHYFSCVHNLLGDPEFEIWTDLPQQFSDISISRNNTFTNISGISADSTIIAFYNNRGETRIITTDSLNITVNANPNSTIMLYKHNYIPYIAPLVLQKVSLSRSQYVIASDVVAGSSVDSGRTSGDVTVKEGVEYEIEASGTVTLQDGFNVEKGATFAVYPSCF